MIISFSKYLDIKTLHTQPSVDEYTKTLNTENLLEETILVNADNPLPKNFKPKNIINLYQQKDRHFQLAKSNIKISKTVYYAMNSMFKAAEKDGISNFIITSGYRSYDKQQEIFSKDTNGVAAKPGESEHETGLAFDVTTIDNKDFALTSQFKWLADHCAEYGFIIRYPKGMENITGYPYEPWHYRYVGVSHAKEIMSTKITLEEYTRYITNLK